VARKLGEEEKALWGRVMATVTPMHPVLAKPVKVNVIHSAHGEERLSLSKARLEPQQSFETALALRQAQRQPLLRMSGSNILPVSKPQPTLSNSTLDGTWDRQITKGALIPDVSVDLHGSGLSSAYTRLDGALEQAIAQKLRVVLLVTGRPRMHDRTTGEGRGAIASVVRDWLAASRHSSAIAAVRGAHPRHGGAGALYIVLKR
jgi:DNA-nicking Smr family endonuclease